MRCCVRSIACLQLASFAWSSVTARCNSILASDIFRFGMVGPASSPPTCLVPPLPRRPRSAIPAADAGRLAATSQSGCPRRHRPPWCPQSRRCGWWLRCHQATGREGPASAPACCRGLNRSACRWSAAPGRRSAPMSFGGPRFDRYTARHRPRVAQRPGNTELLSPRVHGCGSTLVPLFVLLGGLTNGNAGCCILPRLQCRSDLLQRATLTSSCDRTQLMPTEEDGRPSWLGPLRRSLRPLLAPRSTVTRALT